MMHKSANVGLLLAAAVCLAGTAVALSQTNDKLDSYVLDYETAVNPRLQSKLEQIDADLRAKYGITTEQSAVGLLDLKTLQLAMIHPDHEEYAASIPKVGILLAYFELHPEAATNLTAQTRHELGLMAKASNNEMAAKFSMSWDSNRSKRCSTHTISTTQITAEAFGWASITAVVVNIIQIPSAATATPPPCVSCCAIS